MTVQYNVRCYNLTKVKVLLWISVDTVAVNPVFGVYGCHGSRS